jgi:hypothetical protein
MFTEREKLYRGQVSVSRFIEPAYSDRLSLEDISKQTGILRSGSVIRSD